MGYLLALGIVAIILTWVFYLICFCALGLSLQNLFIPDVDDPIILFSSFWLGWSLLIIFLQIWHLFFAVNIIAFTIFSVVSAICIYLNWTKLMLLRNIIPKRFYTFLMYFVILSILVAIQSMEPTRTSDTGLYHVQSIKWISSYPIIPGLGNLHYRLAYNNSFFLYASLLGTGVWKNMSQHLANGLLFLVILLQTGLSLIKILFNEKSLSPSDIVAAVLIIPLAILCKIFTSSTSPDMPVFILGTVTCISLFNLIYESKNDNMQQYMGLFIIIISVIGITVKSNFMVYGLCMIFVVLIKMTKDYIRNTENRIKLSLLFIGIVCVIFLWIARGVILSGYIAYPFPYIPVNVEWKMPFDAALQDYLWVKSWARLPYVSPELVLSNSDWIIPWLKRSLTSGSTILGISLPLIITILSLSYIGRNFNQYRTDLYWNALFLAPSLFSGFFWFFSAPDPRFAGVIFWYLGAGTYGVACRKFAIPWRKMQLLTATFVTFSVLLFILVFNFKKDNVKFPKYNSSPSIFGFYPLPIVELNENITNSGLRVFIPKQGDQCWDAPLPCASRADELNPNLRLRREEDIRYGFMISRD